MAVNLDEYVERFRMEVLAFLERKTGKTWTVTAERNNWDFRFTCTLEGVRRYTPWGDLGQMNEMNQGAIIAAWSGGVYNTWKREQEASHAQG